MWICYSEKILYIIVIIISEGILIPTPFYGGFLIDLKLRAEVVAFPVYLSEDVCMKCYICYIYFVMF